MAAYEGNSILQKSLIFVKNKTNAQIHAESPFQLLASYPIHAKAEADALSEVFETNLSELATKEDLTP